MWNPTKIKEARIEARYSQIAAAIELKITRQHLGQIERGNHVPGRLVIEAMCKLYGKSATYFLSDEAAAADVVAE